MGISIGFGPRLARISFGSGGTRLSSRVGPVTASLGGRRRRRPSVGRPNMILAWAWSLGGIGVMVLAGCLVVWIQNHTS